MSTKFLFRRATALAGLVALTAGAAAIAVAPAEAATPLDVVTSVSPSTAHPGDIVTVTQTITNNNPLALLQPLVQLTSASGNLTDYTSLVGCSGAITCTTLNDVAGLPLGYQAALPATLPLGGTSVVTYTLQVLPDAPDVTQLLQGQLLGLGFLSDLIDGVQLIIEQLPTPPPPPIAPLSQISVSPSTAHPGDIVTVTQTVTNGLLTALSQPVARLLSTPSNLASYTSLVGCSGAASCSTVTDASGNPIGYEAALPNSLGPLGGSSVVTYTLKVLPTAPALTEVLQGQLLGLDFLSDLIDGVGLIIETLPGPPPPPIVPVSQISVSPSTAHPGDIVTVTQTVTNNLATTLLQPVARLLSAPVSAAPVSSFAKTSNALASAAAAPGDLPLTSFTSLVGCTGATCSVVNDASGNPMGYQAVLPTSLNPLGGTSVITYTLQVLPTAPDLEHVLQGQLLGLNFLSSIINAVTLIIETLPLPPPPPIVPVSQISVSPSTAHPGDIVTVTQTVTNNLATTLLQPVAQLFSAPVGVAPVSSFAKTSNAVASAAAPAPLPLTSFTSLVGCSGATCSVVNGPNGQPAGYKAVLPTSLNPLGGTSVITYTLKILSTAPDLEQMLQGQLLGLNFLSGLIDGVKLIVDAASDAVVSVVATPKFGFFVKQLDIAVKVLNKGPGLLRVGQITTTVPGGLKALPNGPCSVLGSKVICTVNSLVQNGTSTMHFKVPLKLFSFGLPYKFTGTRTSSLSRDLIPGNDTATAKCFVFTRLLVKCS